MPYAADERRPRHSLTNVRLALRVLTRPPLEWLVALGVSLSLGLHVVFAGPAGLLFQDDAYYYFNIARHLARGDGLTFDGLHATNGFQPLWLVVCWGVQLVFHDAVTALRAVLVVEVGLLSGVAFVMVRVLRSTSGPWAAAAGGLWLAAAPGATSVLRSGMESALVVALLAVLWRTWARRGWWSTGVCCAALFLARLEAGLAPFVLAALAHREIREQPARLVALVAPTLVCAAGYTAWNLVVFETWGPLSGAVKVWRSARLGPLDRLAGLLEFPWVGQRVVCRVFGNVGVGQLPAAGAWLLAGLTTTALAAALRWRAQVVEGLRRADATGVLAVATAICVANALLVGSHAWAWVGAPIVFATGLVLAGLVGRGPRRRQQVLLAGVAALALARIPWNAYLGSQPELRYAHHRITAARWVRQNVPAAVRVGSWNAGTFGYYADRTVVNLDGLVNDRPFFERVLLGGDLEGYLEDTGIRWVADEACGPNPRPLAYLPKDLARRFQLRFATYHRSTNGCPGFAVWERPPDPGN